MTVTLPPVATNWLPELHEGRDGMREVFKLVNQLRRRVVGYAPGQALAWFSTAIGRGDVLTLKGATETVLFPYQLPQVFPAFTLNFSAELLDSASAGIARVRLGGTYGNTDGLAVATLNASSTGFQYASTAPSVTLNTATLVQVTLQSTLGNTMQMRGGFLLGN